jgi:hypothetical protein
MPEKENFITKGSEETVTVNQTKATTLVSTAAVLGLSLRVFYILLGIFFFLIRV